MTENVAKKERRKPRRNRIGEKEMAILQDLWTAHSTTINLNDFAIALKSLAALGTMPITAKLYDKLNAIKDAHGDIEEILISFIKKADAKAKKIAEKADAKAKKIAERIAKHEEALRKLKENG